MHVRLPGVQSVDLQFALVNEWYEDEKIHSLALVRTGIVGSADIEEFSISKDSASQATNHVIDLHSCLYHLVQIARFRAKDYISRGVVLV